MDTPFKCLPVHPGLLAPVPPPYLVEMIRIQEFQEILISPRGGFEGDQSIVLSLLPPYDSGRIPQRPKYPVQGLDTRNGLVADTIVLFKTPGYFVESSATFPGQFFESIRTISKKIPNLLTPQSAKAEPRWGVPMVVREAT